MKRDKYFNYIADSILKNTTTGFGEIGGDLCEVVTAPFYRQPSYRKVGFVQKLVRNSAVIRNEFAKYIKDYYGCPVKFSDDVFEIYKKRFIGKYYSSDAYIDK
jgi:hypothetical protein